MHYFLWVNAGVIHHKLIKLPATRCGPDKDLVLLKLYFLKMSFFPLLSYLPGYLGVWTIISVELLDDVVLLKSLQVYKHTRIYAYTQVNSDLI